MCSFFYRDHKITPVTPFHMTQGSGFPENTNDNYY